MSNKIVIVGNNIKDRDRISTRLRYNKYEILQTTEGLHGLSLIEKEAPISLVVIIDTLSDMQPIEFVSLIRDHHTKEQLKIILVSMRKGQSNSDFQSLIDESTIIIEESDPINITKVIMDKIKTWPLSR